MRVIGGEMKRRTLHAPAGWATRPSSDRLRESLFNILGERVRGALFVDAYAGTGAVGIEAYSRGARPVVWIENAPAALQALRANLAALQIPGCVIDRPAAAALARLGALPQVRAAGGADFIFLDPPYGQAREYARALAALARAPQLLHAASTVVVESRRGWEPPLPAGLRLARLHPSGDTQLLFYTPAAS